MFENASQIIVITYISTFTFCVPDSVNNTILKINRTLQEQLCYTLSHTHAINVIFYLNHRR